MAVIKIGYTVEGTKIEYQASTADAVNTFPTNCGPGSTLVTVDPVTHSPVDGYYFDGVGWGKV
jgi:hypothetical protein